MLVVIAAEVKASQERQPRADVDAVGAMGVHEGFRTLAVWQPSTENEQLRHGSQSRHCPKDNDIFEPGIQQHDVEQRHDGDTDNLPMRIVGAKKLEKPTGQA